MLSPALILLFAAPEPAAAAAPPVLTIVCKGDVERRAAQPGFAPDRAGLPEESLTLELDPAGSARVKVPASIIPTLHGRAEGGWWAVKTLHIDNAEIRGVLGFNFFDKAEVVIDKGLWVATATSNLGRFVGKCEKVEGQ